MKNILRRWLGNDFLLILVCYVAYTAKYLTYLLMSTEVIQIWEFDNLHMTQKCAKIIVGFIANVGNVFYPTFTNLFLFSPHFTFLTFFLIFISTFTTSMFVADGIHWNEFAHRKISNVLLRHVCDAWNVVLPPSILTSAAACELSVRPGT